jgi:hypothetical protein
MWIESWSRSVRIETGKKIKDELNGCLSAQYLGMSALVTYRLSLTQKLGVQVRENSLRDVKKAKESKLYLPENYCATEYASTYYAISTLRLSSKQQMLTCN